MADDLTPTILREIRDELVAFRADSNQRFAELHERVDGTNARLDRLAEGQIRLATDVAEIKGDVAELKERMARMETRFDRSLVRGGQSHRDLEGRVRRLEVHTGLEE